MDFRKILKEAFPLMNEEKLGSIFNGLNSLLESQCLSVDDIKFLEPQDLSPHLEVFQARKLIGFIKASTLKEDGMEKSLSSSICTAKDAEKIMEPFEIMYDRIPKKIMKILAEDKRADTSTRKTLVQYVVDSILEKKENPGRKVISKYAEELTLKFPNSLCDKISKNGNVIGNGSYSLLIQLENRVANLKRKKKEKIIIEDTADHDDPHKNPKSSRVNEYGCRAWQPSMPDGESLESLESKQKDLLNFHNLEQSKWNYNEILSLMADTYYLQRLDLNNNMKVAEMKLRWPFLLQVNCINSHFKFLTGIDAIKSLRNFIASESKQMIKYFTSMGNAVPACLKLEKELNKSSTSKTEVIGLIFMLAVSLKEDIRDMFHKIEEEADENNLSDIPTTPCLIFKSQSAFVSEKFLLAVDKELFGSTNDAISAIASLFSLYYIFNIKYSTETPATLEFIQRFIMGINPEKGSKLPKKKGNRQWSMSPPVLSLINSINSFKELYL